MKNDAKLIQKFVPLREHLYLIRCGQIERKIYTKWMLNQKCE